MKTTPLMSVITIWGAKTLRPVRIKPRQLRSSDAPAPTARTPNSSWNLAHSGPKTMMRIEGPKPTQSATSTLLPPTVSAVFVKIIRIRYLLDSGSRCCAV